jgi:DNA sulfur modification protein DndD
MRSTLVKFRDAVVTRHAERIAHLVLECFQRLARKPGLVAQVRIDPRTFQLDLSGADGSVLRAEQFSAGERQLLAISMLWGLARASGRPLPTVIDTPLGRLDSSHRERLVERYFPHASHQVVLLSTDEEIAGGYHDRLKPWVGRSYRLDFDEATGRTAIAEGYLEVSERRNVA